MQLATGRTPWEGSSWAYVATQVADGKRLRFPDSSDASPLREITQEEANVAGAPISSENNGGDTRIHGSSCTGPKSAGSPSGITPEDMDAIRVLSESTWLSTPSHRPKSGDVLNRLRDLLSRGTRAP